MARLVPALRLIAETGVIASYLVRGSPDGALQQMPDLVLQDRVGRKPDRVAGTLGFKKLIDLGIGESGVASEIQMPHDAPVPCDHRLQHRAPTIGTMHIARPQCASLDVAELIKHEQRVVTGAAEMPVVSAAFLFAVEPAPAQAGVGLSLESMSSITVFDPRRRRTLSIQWPGRSASAARFSGRLSHFVSKRPIWLAEAADPLIARSPTTQRIAGSRHSLSASFTSS